MAVSFQLDIVTPEKSVVSIETTSVIAPGAEGYFGVLPDHTPFLTTLTPGTVQIGTDDDAVYLAITSGFAEIRPDRVIVLIDKCMGKEDVDVQAAQEDLDTSNKAIEAFGDGMDEKDPDYILYRERKAFAESCLQLVKRK